MKSLEQRNNHCNTSELEEFKRAFLQSSCEDARYILFFFIFSASFSLYFDLMQSISAFILYSLVLLVKYKKQNRKKVFYNMLLIFCASCFVFTFLIKSINYDSIEQALVFLDIREHLLFSFEYALHLALLGILGLCLFTWLSAKEYACAIAWYCSFVSKKQAWKLALVSLLVLRYFSTMLALAKELKMSAQYMLRKEKSFTKKLTLYMAKLFSLLADRNYELSVALFSRRMNKEEVFLKKWQKKPFFSYANFKTHLIAFFVFLFSLLQLFLNDLLLLISKY